MQEYLKEGLEEKARNLQSEIMKMNPSEQQIIYMKKEWETYKKFNLLITEK
jgi:hypothetical protein